MLRIPIQAVPSVSNALQSGIILSYVIDIALLLVIGTLFVVLLLAITVPQKVFRSMIANFKRRDGSWSGRRFRQELRALGDVVGNLVLGTFAIAILTVSPVVIVHSTIVPVPMIIDIFGAFNVDPVAWEAAIETQDLGDVGASYEAWGEKKGYSENRLRFWQEFLWTSWSLILGLSALFGIGFYWFMTRYFLRMLSKYGKGVIKRERRYRKYDLGSSR